MGRRFSTVMVSPGPSHRQAWSGKRGTLPNGIAGPDLPAGLREPDALGRLSYRHRGDMPLAAVLHMPSGWLISGLCLAGGVFCGCLTAKQFSCAEKGWGKKGLITIIFVTMDGLLFSLYRYLL